MAPSRPREALERLFAPGLAFVRRHPRATLYAAALALHLALAPFFIHDWDGYVFIHTARDFLDGRSPYLTVEQEPTYIYVGDGVPVTNSWYAYPPIALLLMTPFYGIMTFLLGAAPWVERVGIKLPFILGDLALAFVAAGLVRATLADPALADRRAALVERVLLFNPFLIFISAAWGMFDSWMIAFFLASVWALSARRHGLAGALFAFAVLVKPFVAVLAPLLLAYALRQGHRAGTMRWMGAGVLTAVAICLPFFLTAPQGFIQQVVLNHAGRAPQGFAIVSLPLAFSGINAALGTALPTTITPEHISRWSFFLMLFLLCAAWVQAASIRSARDVVVLSLACLTGMLLVSKVVNEQYFVMPLSLAAVAFALSDQRIHLWTRRLYTFGGTVSGLLLGYHFVTFIPLDVAARVFPFPADEVVPRLVGVLGWTGEQAYVYPTLIAALSLVPAFVISCALVGREALRPLGSLRHLTLARPRPPPATVALLFIVLLLAPASGALLAATPVDDPTRSFEPPEGRLVGAYYYLWWHNPSHDPGIEYGNWRQGVTHLPLEGYYTTTAGKMRNDFRDMKEAGIDLVVYPYQPHDKPKLPAVTRLAAQAGLTTAPLIELNELIHRSEHQPRDADGNGVGDAYGLSMRDGTRDAIVARITDPLLEFSHFATWWRVDGKPVVFLRPTHAVFPDVDGPTHDRFVDAALRIAHEDVARGHAAEAPTRAVLRANVPQTLDELRLPDNTLWRRAYHETVRDFWEDVALEVERRAGPVHIVGGLTWDPIHGSDRGAALGLAREGALESTFIFSLSDVWQNHLGEAYPSQLTRWDEANLLQAHVARGQERLLVATVTPGQDDRPLRKEHGFVVPFEHDGVLTYDRTWSAATALAPDLILIDSWNNHRAGNALEPTHERGHSLLVRTAEHIQAWKAQAEPERANVLLITNHLGAAYHDTSGDPDASRLFSARLATAAEAWRPGRIAAVEWNAPHAAHVDLAGRLVLIEPGSKRPLADTADGLVDAVRRHVEQGGDAILLGSDVGAAWARLATWGEPPVAEGRLELETPSGRIPIPPGSVAMRHDIPQEATVLLWMDDGRERHPAVWQVDLGEGRLVVTAFRPQGGPDSGPVDARLFQAVLDAATTKAVTP